MAQTGKTNTYTSGDTHFKAGTQIARPTATIPNIYNMNTFFMTLTPFSIVKGISSQSKVVLQTFALGGVPAAEDGGLSKLERNNATIQSL
jgi:hypothetical protein